MTETGEEELADHDQQSVHEHEKFFPTNISVMRKHTGNPGIFVQSSILIWLTLQNTVHTLLLRYSRIRVVDEVFLPSVAVFFTEILKIITCLLFIIYEEKSIYSMLHLVKRQVFDNSKDTLKVCIPAVIYVIQNNLFYVAASHLEAATFMVTAQLKIFTTAIFTIIILKRAITRNQWLSLGILFVGICFVQLEQRETKKTFASSNPYLGFLAAVFACILSGFAGIYFEKILKTSPSVSVWMRNVQLAIFGIPSSFFNSIMQDHEIIFNEGMLYGFDMLVWVVIFWYSIGGLSVAVCIRYSGNIAKNFATSAAIVTTITISDFPTKSVSTHILEQYNLVLLNYIVDGFASVRRFFSLFADKKSRNDGECLSIPVLIESWIISPNYNICYTIFSLHVTPTLSLHDIMSKLLFS
ncbi:UDP-galactose/UDP-N-acetylglucosamine transporter srf-3 [Dirofilaria immitis]